MKPSIRAAGLGLALLAWGCGGPSGPPEKPASPPPAVTDTAPVGEGLKTIAFAFLGAAVVLTLGRLLR